jgi:PAS domain S-box-containing protein
MSVAAAPPPAAVDAARIDAALLRERLHLYETNLWPAVASQSVVAALVAGAFWRPAGAAAVGTWIGIVLLSLLVRIVVGLHLRRAQAARQAPALQRLWMARLAVTASGVAWGAAGLLFFSPTDLQSQTLLAFVLAGVAAGSLSMTAFDLLAAFFFAVATLLPMGLRMVGSGDSADTTMGIMVLLFLALLGLTGRRGQSQVREMVTAREAERQRADSLLQNQQRLQQLSDELRRQSDALNQTLDSMDQGILSLDEQGRTRFFNRRLAELLDIPESFFAARPTMDEIGRYQREHGHFGENYALAEQKLREHLEGWYAGVRTPFPQTYLRRTPNGTMLEVKSRYLPGAGLVRTFSDVTAFFETRQRLQLSQAEEGKLAMVAAHTDNAVAITDAQARVEWVNEAFTRLTGVAPEQALGRTLSELLRGEGSDAAALQRMDEELRSRHKAAAELRYQLKSGRVLWLSLEILAVLGPDAAVRHYISIGRDFTARHDAEEALRAARDEAERASRAKSEFLSSMSHELRTPMNAILGFAQLLATDARQPLADAHRGHLRHILQAGTHLLALIDDVLDLARVEAGKQPIQLEPVALGPLLRECLDLVHPLAEQRQVRLDGGDAVDGAGCVTADRTRLKQVLLNLLSNAIKYNREGGQVRLAHGETPDESWLDISDTGLGFAQEQQARLFTAFDRLGAEDGPIQGAGIGLALSKRMLELMSGRIEVRSEVGVGSTFRLWLQRQAAPAPGPAREAGAGAGGAAASPTPAAPVARRVLYIEDNPVNAMLMEAVLERLPGVRLECASLPEVGLQLARARPPDLVLLDIQLPGIDGFEVLRRLRAEATTQAIPVVAVSANAMPGDIERARHAGFDDYLTKPIDFERLLDLVQRCGPGRDRARPGPAGDDAAATPATG